MGALLNQYGPWIFFIAMMFLMMRFGGCRRGCHKHHLDMDRTTEKVTASK